MFSLLELRSKPFSWWLQLPSKLYGLLTGRGRPLAFRQDDFDWRFYNQHYRGEIEGLQTYLTQILRPGDYVYSGGTLSRQESIFPLHPNHQLLYETLIQLSPRSILECGCGGGDHLHNLSLFLPEAQLFGIDRDEAQLAFLQERHPDLKAQTRQCDLTRPLREKLRSDVCFTQAVIMHIQTGNGPKKALENVFAIASQQVVLMENWSKHHFKDRIEELFAAGLIPWPELHLYLRRSSESSECRILIASRVPLPFEPLTTYGQLCN